MGFNSGFKGLIIDTDKTDRQNKIKQDKTSGETSMPTRQTTINSQQAKRNADD